MLLQVGVVFGSDRSNGHALGVEAGPTLLLGLTMLILHRELLLHSHRAAESR